MNTEIKALRAIGQVKACPICGDEWSVHCWHDGIEEVATVAMPVIEAIEKLAATISNMERKIEDLKSTMRSYEAVSREVPA